ncbi:hypothetical protein BaOVIS_027420 [Babesia ovis]|uniref:Uncharacterized protein n=1 Tax=Babesia ovis TaxID=5869 RepID=A0A9W5TE73_BABOV|nr:hypothetical protein BaOVIS_027420 [Babesia ovis]
MAKQISEVCAEIRQLAQNNKFKELVKLLSDLAYKYEKNPRRLIAVLTMRIYYNIQLNANQSVVSDINLIKSPYSDKWMYDSYPDKYGDKRGSMCPFSLYLMYSYYPYIMGSAYTALDRLYTLREHLEDQLSEAPERQQVLVSRIICVALLLADVLLSEKRLMDALKELLRLHRGYGKDDHATNAMLSMVYAQIGDMANAQKHIDIAIGAGSEYTELYRGVHCAVQGDFENAHTLLRTCSQSFERETSLVVAACENILINNVAVTLFYMNNAAAAKVTMDSCKNVCKTGKIFRAVTLNTTMLKELVADIDSKYLDIATT